jgi:hypothetical protein
LLRVPSEAYPAYLVVVSGLFPVYCGLAELCAFLIAELAALEFN